MLKSLYFIKMYILKFFFNFGFFLLAFGMSLFSCCKFWLDKDICIVDYKPSDDSSDIEYLHVINLFKQSFHGNCT